ncbi:hypothetical protein P879_04779, partial [Paragonimus westermani]
MINCSCAYFLKEAQKYYPFKYQVFVTLPLPSILTVLYGIREDRSGCQSCYCFFSCKRIPSHNGL